LPGKKEELNTPGRAISSVAAVRGLDFNDFWNFSKLVAFLGTPVSTALNEI
jgi:hypothetical protein